jgi:hypothetical protein
MIGNSKYRNLLMKFVNLEFDPAAIGLGGDHLIFSDDARFEQNLITCHDVADQKQMNRSKSAATPEAMWCFGASARIRDLRSGANPGIGFWPISSRWSMKVSAGLRGPASGVGAIYAADQF